MQYKKRVALPYTCEMVLEALALNPLGSKEEKRRLAEKIKYVQENGVPYPRMREE